MQNIIILAIKMKLLRLAADEVEDAEVLEVCC